VRHLAVGEGCPIDAAPTSRRHCSGCPEFVSFRSSRGVATIGCEHGQDTVSWLRREMMTPVLALGPGDAALAKRPAIAAPRRTVSRRRTSAAPLQHRRHQGRAGNGPSVAMFAAAVGVGILLSALDRNPRRASA
jgi:hypothetical protein